jgi:hypothetical protein
MASGNTLLLIVSRGTDPVAPLLHQFTYEAFVRETLAPTEELLLDETDKSSLVVLNYYEDELFRKLRFLEYQKLQDVIEPEIAPFRELEKQAKEGESTQIRSEATKKLARENRRRCEAGNHYHILGKLSDLISGKPLVSVSEFEQSLATGSESGKEFKPTVAKLSAAVMQTKLDPIDAARVMALFHIRLGLPESDIDKLCTTIRIEQQHRRAIANVRTALGTPIPRKTEAMLVKDAFKTDKYIPLVSELVGNAVEGKLDAKFFEVPAHTGRYQNVVLFVVGGISFMELRWLDNTRARLKGTKLYVGSTTYLTPRAFLAQTAIVG